MGQKNKKHVSAEKLKRVLRFKNAFWLNSPGDTPSGSTERSATRVYSRKAIEKIKSRSYQIRVVKMLERSDGSHTIVDSVRERDVVYVLELADKMQRSLRDIRDESRRESRTYGGGGGGGEPPIERIFHRLVDEDKMADCILRIKEGFFHAEKECVICDKNCTVYDFFMLAYFYFCYIGIMDKHINQSAYCRYLNKKVFGGVDTVNVRNFNNYTKMDAYVNFDGLLSDNKNIRFDSRPQLPQPKTEHFLLAPFQELGWKFQHSPYFTELKREQKRVQDFVL